MPLREVLSSAGLTFVSQDTAQPRDHKQVLARYHDRTLLILSPVWTIIYVDVNVNHNHAEQ